MREDGLALKKSAASTQQQIAFNVSHIVYDVNMHLYNILI